MADSTAQLMATWQFSRPGCINPESIGVGAITAVELLEAPSPALLNRAFTALPRAFLVPRSASRSAMRAKLRKKDPPGSLNAAPWGPQFPRGCHGFPSVVLAFLPGSSDLTQTNVKPERYPEGPIENQDSRGLAAASSG